MAKIALGIIGILQAVVLILLKGDAPESIFIVMVLCLGFVGVIEAIEKLGKKKGG